VRRFEDLVAWQLAFALQKGIFAFTAIGPVWHDVKYREQIRDSSASATRNTAEGFGRFRPKDFARFLEIAHGSLDETRSHLHDGHHRSYRSAAEYADLLRLNYRALAANTRLLRYLRSCS
jgi:four helix bundle protein